jgi:tetratricopeptide (TPR) repeat protein
MRRCGPGPTLEPVEPAAPSPSLTGRSAGRVLLAAAGLAVATLAVYAPAFGFDFVHYDDGLYVAAVPEVREGLSVEGLRWAFTSFQGANWFPLTRLSWMLDAELFGLDPGAFHRTNVLLHALAAALFVLALVRLTGELGRSAWVAAVFALHPLHVESVAWVASRKDVLSGVFAAASLLAYAAAARRGGFARHGLVFALLAAGLMAKPTLVVWPAVFLLLDAWPLRRLERDGHLDAGRIVAALREKLPLFALVVLASLLTLAAQSEGGTLRSLEHMPAGMRLANAFDAIAAYGADAFWPRGLAVFYPYPAATASRLGAAVGAASVVAVTALCFGLWRRVPALAVGWLWALGALAPVIGIVQVGQAARADRYTYLPLVGLALAVAWGVGALTRGRWRVVVAVVALGSLLALGAATRVQLATWRDSEHLFGHALRVTEGNHVAHINLGVALLERDRLDEASSHLNAALRVAPASPFAAGLLADVRVRQDRTEEAIRLYRRALAIDPDSRRWRVSLARVLAESGRPEEAVRVLQEGEGQADRSAR